MNSRSIATALTATAAGALCVLVLTLWVAPSLVVTIEGLLGHGFDIEMRPLAGTGTGLQAPEGIAYRDGHLYVSDTQAMSIFRFDLEGRGGPARTGPTTSSSASEGFRDAAAHPLGHVHTFSQRLVSAERTIARAPRSSPRDCSGPAARGVPSSTAAAKSASSPAYDFM